MSMEYQKIHACPNDCILYKREFEGLHECSMCGVSSYKQKDSASSSDVRTKGSPLKLYHLANSPQWKTINQLFPEFKNKLRNLRVGLAIDGMNLMTIIRLYFFFSAICSKVIYSQKLDELENDVIIILCQLEI
ncbi:hypothetical protein L6164_037393 [Bauhinia variegata]|uniref:Uncharacterized protein n=1 Tax=Bauhinia variegata TaxID=167791 RepID=A0ACB9KJZ3_BAUVA|nr:hypothetical protein L6164_037393 [Bauhinia variegata]